MATKYLDDDGKHKPKDEMKEFKGNLIFASHSVVCFNRPSRKDDLISLLYFMLFLLNGGQLPLLFQSLELIEQSDFEDKIKFMRDFKIQNSLYDMLKKINIS